MWASRTFSSVMRSLTPVKKQDKAPFSPLQKCETSTDLRKNGDDSGASSKNVKNGADVRLDTGDDEGGGRANRDLQAPLWKVSDLRADVGVDATRIDVAEENETALTGTACVKAQGSAVMEAGDTRRSTRMDAVSQVLVGTFGDTSGLEGLETESDEYIRRERDEDIRGSEKILSKHHRSREEAYAELNRSPAIYSDGERATVTNPSIYANDEEERSSVEAAREGSRKRSRSKGQRKASLRRFRTIPRTKSQTKEWVLQDGTERIPGATGNNFKEQDTNEPYDPEGLVEGGGENGPRSTPLSVDRLLFGSPKSPVRGRTATGVSPLSPLESSANPESADTLKVPSGLLETNALEPRVEDPLSEVHVHILNTQT
jgi:hypothetical protein